MNCAIFISYVKGQFRKKMQLSQILNVEVYKLLIIFTRIGIIFMTMPLFSTAFVYAKFRLGMALILSFILYPAVARLIPPAPSTILELFCVILNEAMIGIFFSLFVNIIFTSLEIATAQTTFSVGFSHSMVFDPFQGQQTMLLNSFAFITAYALLFVLDLHHLLLRAMYDSYTLFHPGKGIPVDDMFNYLIKTLDKSFRIGSEISFPFIALTFVMQTSMAVIAKLMPQLNILFLAMPAQIYFGMHLFAIIIGMIMMYFVQYFTETINNFIPL